MPEVLGEKKYVIVVTSRIKFARHDMVLLNVNPSDPRILYVNNENSDRLNGLPRKTPWVEAGTWGGGGLSEQQYAELEARFGSRQPNLKTALKKAGIEVDVP